MPHARTNILLCDIFDKKTAARPFLFFIRITMKLVMDVAEAFVGYVCVNLSCGNVAVAQKFLDASQVNALVH